MSDPIRIYVSHWSDGETIDITDAIAADIVRRALVHDDTVRAGVAGLIQRLMPADIDTVNAQLERSMLAAGETQDALQRECAEHGATKSALEAVKEKYDTEFDAWAEANRALAAMRERAEAAEAAAAYHLGLSDNLSRRGITLQEQRDAAVAEVAALRTQLSGSMAAAKNDVDALRAELHVTKLSVYEWHADSERLSLEVAALKARKVKIGDITSPAFYGDIEFCAFHRGVRKCADAIRAAGVEVA